MTQPSTHAEAAAQTDEKGSGAVETTESLRVRMATIEREYELKLEVSGGNAQTIANLVETYKQAAGEAREKMKQEYGGWLDKDFAAHETTRKKLVTLGREYEARLEAMERMKREHEAEVEVLKGRVETSHHKYTESAAQIEKVLDKTTALPEEIPEEIPTREEGGRESYTLASATQTEESWALDKIAALPEEIPTPKEGGRKSYAQAARQVTPITIAPPELMPAAHTVALDDWEPYEDLSDYEKESWDSDYESGGLGSNWRRVGRRRERAEKPTSGSQPDRPYAQAVVIHGVPVRYKRGMMGRWIQEDNTGVEVMAVRWLSSEDRRRGKEASSLVIYTKAAKEIAAMRLGGKHFPTEKYDWNRGHPRQRDSGI